MATKKTALAHRRNGAVLRVHGRVAPVKPGAAYAFVKNSVIPKFEELSEHMARATYLLYIDSINPSQPVPPQQASNGIRASAVVGRHIEAADRQRRLAGLPRKVK